MRQAKQGDKVRVHYTGKVANDSVFDSTNDRAPLEFTIGAGQVIPGFEGAVMGMNAGESKTTKVPAEKAFGLRHEEFVMQLDRNELPEELGELKAGQRLELGQGEGKTVPVTVTNISESSVTLDANHPLAGRELTFHIELLEIA